MPSGTAMRAVVNINHTVPRMPARNPVRSGNSVESYLFNKGRSKRGDPSITVSTIRTSRTMTPKNRENQSSTRKTSERGVVVPAAARGDRRLNGLAGVLEGG